MSTQVRQPTAIPVASAIVPVLEVSAPVHVVDPELELLVPDDDVADPELSIVVPALNEQLMISDFVAWCKEGLKKANCTGEILIVNSSTDDTGKLALAGGARVLDVGKPRLLAMANGSHLGDGIPLMRS